MAVGFSLETTLQGGESLELNNIYAALATVISKPEVYSCAEDRASLLLRLLLPANEQETPKGANAIVSTWEAISRTLAYEARGQSK